VHARQVPAVQRKTQPLPMPAGPGLSKLSSVRAYNVEVDVILGELNSRTEDAVKAQLPSTGSTPTGMNFRIP
jgi:hypothetical protein